MLITCIASFMELHEKPKLIIFAKFSILNNRDITLNLGCWLKGAYYKRAKGRLSNVFSYDKSDDKFHLLYVFDYSLAKHEIILTRFEIVKSIDRDGDFITEHN